MFYKSLNKKVNNVTLNIGFGKPKSVNFLSKLIEVKNFSPKRPGEPFITHADIKKAKKTLKWSPNILLTEGIQEVLENIEYWKNATLWDKKKIRKATKNWFKYLS